eukprot:CAMPEP_0115875940 /NCGR_PEP_ID=MMETSP0287-20121206/25380_1 /TAXON_ID=412157 /ORGANISM="Chrysochromulina rotalis, Strain UIO044" /LENGTH=140 /DNA_ID=CAMNT_0003331267 /DNA_START=419 /DNA_END=841 /DNA_ORIENTATION=+
MNAIHKPQTNVAIQIGAHVCKHYHARRGRVILACLLLCTAGNFGTTLASNLPVEASTWVVGRGALNAVFPLKQTLLMDHTPKKIRGRWSAISNINMATFSGGAAVGGLLIELVGYRETFLVMSLSFAASTLLWLPLANAP